MENVTDKKWFLYLSDHQEGPFSFQEIESKYIHNQVSERTFVWGRGMDNWKTLTEIDDFSRLPESVQKKSHPEVTRSILENTKLTLVEELENFKIRPGPRHS